MYFTCEFCYQDSAKRTQFTCKRYSAWLKHLTRAEHVQSAAQHYQKWGVRENNSSIVVVLLPGKKKGSMRLTDEDMLEHFAEDGLIQDFYFDGSRNFAVIQFDDSMAKTKINQVKYNYVKEGFLAHPLMKHSGLLFPKAAAVFNDDQIWKFLKDNREVGLIKTRLSPTLVDHRFLELGPFLDPVEPTAIASQSQLPDSSTATKPKAPDKIISTVYINSKLQSAGASNSSTTTPDPLVAHEISKGISKLSIQGTISVLTEQPAAGPSGTSVRNSHILSSANSSRTTSPHHNGKSPKHSSSKPYPQPNLITPATSKVEASPNPKQRHRKNPPEKVRSKTLPEEIKSERNNSKSVNQIVDDIIRQCVPAPAHVPQNEVHLPHKLQQEPVFRPQPFPILVPVTPIRPNPFYPPMGGASVSSRAQRPHTVVGQNTITFQRTPQLKPMPQSQNPAPNPAVMIEFNPFLMPVPVESYEIYYYLFREPSRPNKSAASIAQKEKLKLAFRSLPLDAQLETFNSATTLTVNERNMRLDLIQELEGFLRREFPRVSLYAFGSLVTSLGGTCSDIDLVVDLQGNLRTGNGTSKVMMRNVQRLLESLGSRKRPIYHIQPILQARIPILRLNHVYTNTNIDLSFENFMSVRNSQLIAHYMRLHPAVRPLMIFVRHWAKVHELSGSFFIKNYALVLLVIHFLSKKKFVPTIEQLQELYDPRLDPDSIINGWNSGFCMDFEKIRRIHPGPIPIPQSHSISWEDLLEYIYNFFIMFAELDYENTVICPLIGECLPRDYFQPGHEEALPDSMERYKIWSSNQDLDSRFRISTPFKLQDPFHLAFNVGSITPAQTLFTFRVGCHQMIQLFHDARTSCKPPSIFDLLQQLPPYIMDRKSFQLQLEAKERLWLSHELHIVIPTDQGSEFDAVDLASVVEPQPSADVDIFRIKRLVEIGKEAAGKRGGALKFGMDRHFYHAFLQTVKKFGVDPDCEDLPTKAKSLWGHFILEYLRDIWKTGFGLTTDISMVWSTPIPVPPEAFHGSKSMAKLRGNFTETIPVNREESDNECAIRLLDEVTKRYEPGLTFYFRITSSSCPPFFVGRKAAYSQVFRLHEAEDDKATNSSSILPTKRRKKKVALLLNVNPVEFEGRVTQTVLEELEKGKKVPIPTLMFQLHSYGKLDMKLEEEDAVPEFQLVFRKLGKGSSVEAFECLVRTIRDTLGKYLLHRLLTFFQVLGEPVGKAFWDVDFDFEDDSEEETEEVTMQITSLGDLDLS